MTGNHSLRAALALVVLLCGCATQSPPERGLSSAGLARIDKAISADVDRGRIPGVVMMVQRVGRLVYSKTLGKQDPASGVRDIEAVNRLAETQRLALTADHAMPANNQLLAWIRRASDSVD